MVLVLNIDNIIIRLGVYNEAKLHAQASFGTRADATADEYAAQLLQMLSLCGVAVADISGSILSSVVPALTAVVARGVAFSIGRPPMILGPGIKSGLNILTENPAELGTDIVACSVAALARCKPPIILADVGTAIVVSALIKTALIVDAPSIPDQVLTARCPR